MYLSGTISYALDAKPEVEDNTLVRCVGETKEEREGRGRRERGKEELGGRREKGES